LHGSDSEKHPVKPRKLGDPESTLYHCTLSEMQITSWLGEPSKRHSSFDKNAMLGLTTKPPSHSVLIGIFRPCYMQVRSYLPFWMQDAANAQDGRCRSALHRQRLSLHEHIRPSSPIVSRGTVKFQRHSRLLYSLILQDQSSGYE
jgi:hypothetical protein